MLTNTNTEPACTNASHELIKLQPERWAALPFAGYIPADEPGDPIVELRDCPLCHSTLGRELPPGCVP